MNRRSLLKAAGAASLAGGSGVTLLGSLPRGAKAAGSGISLIVPGGGRSGLAARILASALQKELAEPVEVVQVDTAREGYMMLASASGNGATFGLVGADMSALHRGIGGSPGVDRITPVALLSEDPAGIHVRHDASWQNAGELLASLRSAPGKLKASGAGRHAVWHLSAQRWMMAAKLGAAAMAWDAAPNPATAAEALVAGGPDIVVCSIPEVRATPFTRQIRTLAVMSGSRSSRYPEVAALAESGVPLRAGFWRGVAGPWGLEPLHLARMQTALQRVHASETFRREMSRRGFSLSWAGAAPFARFVASEDRAMAAAIHSMGGA